VVVVHIRRAGIARSAVYVGRTALETDGYDPVRIGHADAHAVGVASTGLAVTNIVRTFNLHTEATGATLVAVGVFAWRTRARTVSVNLAWHAPCSTYAYTSTAAGQLCARNAVRTDGTGATAATNRVTVTVEVSTTKVFTIVIHAGTGFEVLPKRTGAKATVKVTVTGHGALAVGGTFRPTSAIAFA
jgi:ribosomal protein L11